MESSSRSEDLLSPMETSNQYSHPKESDQCQLGVELGSGTYGTVFLSNYEGKQVAVKKLQTVIRDKNNKLIPKEDTIGKYGTEVKLMNSLKHPNILNLYHSYESGDDFFMVLELVHNGVTLLDLIVGNEKSSEFIKEKIIEEKIVAEKCRHMVFSDTMLLSIINQIVSAVRYCHSCGICHRDIKPENILTTMDKDGKIMIKLADFGFATNFTPEKLLTSSPGTFSYACPQLLLGQPVDGPKADLWAVGVIIYVMITGYFPFGRLDNLKNRSKVLQGQPRYDYSDAPMTIGQIDLLQWIFQTDQKARIGFNEMSQHPWLLDQSNDLTKLTYFGNQMTFSGFRQNVPNQQPSLPPPPILTGMRPTGLLAPVPMILPSYIPFFGSPTQTTEHVLPSNRSAFHPGVYRPKSSSPKKNG